MGLARKPCYVCFMTSDLRTPTKLVEVVTETLLLQCHRLEVTIKLAILSSVWLWTGSPMRYTFVLMANAPGWRLLTSNIAATCNLLHCPFIHHRLAHVLAKLHVGEIGIPNEFDAILFLHGFSIHRRVWTHLQTNTTSIHMISIPLQIVWQIMSITTVLYFCITCHLHETLWYIQKNGKSSYSKCFFMNERLRIQRRNQGPLST